MLAWIVALLVSTGAAVCQLDGWLVEEDSQTATTAPAIELRRGERYFRVGGRPSFVFGRNPVGRETATYFGHLRSAAAAGERLVRIHFTYLPPGEPPGKIDTQMLHAWDAILDRAEREGLVVLPVLGIWADWNDGSRNEFWHTWERNPYNAALGGPAQQPIDLLRDTPGRRLWLERLTQFVTHWAPRKNILAWEAFSEVDLVTGATEADAVEFSRQAAAVIRAHDPQQRPVTISMAGVNEWPQLFESDAVDFVEIHPYAGNPYGGNLDELILHSAADRWRRYRKPVLLGECGLDFGPPRNTLDAAPRAEIGIRHAIWASVVSGAMNGRMLWWHDGYDEFENVDLHRHYHEIAAPAIAFCSGVDRTGFESVLCQPPAELMGAVIGNDTHLVGWFRDAACKPPEWPVRRLSKQQLSVPAPTGTWQAEFFDTSLGTPISSRRVISENNSLDLPLPDFDGSIAFKIQRDTAAAPAR
jgi:hypothetical protein